MEKIAVTGAFGYSGAHITRRLLDDGVPVMTLTNSPHRDHPLAGQIEAHPLAFGDPAALTESLRGCRVLINTYWVRFNHRGFTFRQAVENTRVLFTAARDAGVERIVHTSITNPSLDSPFEYFRGKAELEAALAGLGVSYAILRPAVLFGGSAILINNIAWALRRLPVIGVFGDGQYRLQPIHVEDFAALAVARAADRDDVVVDAIGPETFTYRGLFEQLGRILGCRRPILSVPPRLGYFAAWLLGKLVGDVMLTWEEVGGLSAGLLATDSPPAGERSLTDWAREHTDQLGRRYLGELRRRTDRQRAYATVD